MKFLVFILSFSFTASAVNVRVIGTGGGGGEMAALTTFSLLPQYLPFCVLADNPCHLDADDLSLLKQLVDKQQLILRSPHLAFHDEATPLFKYDRAHTKISMSVTLADKKLGHLSAIEWMFLGYMDYMFETNHAQDLNFPLEWGNLSQALFHALQWSHQVRGNLHFLSLGGRLNRGFLFEDHGSGDYRDLTPKVQNALPCSSSASVRAISSEMGADEQVVTGEVTWSCDGVYSSGILYGRKSNGWTFRVFDVRPVKVMGSPLCSSFLSKSPNSPF